MSDGRQAMAGLASAATTRRVALLLACLAVGITIGVIGEALTQDASWFLAVPACMAVAWLAVADPSRCLASGEDTPADRRRDAGR